MDHGIQRYKLNAAGPPVLVEEIHQYKLAQGEGLIPFLERLAATHPDAAEIVLHRREGRIAYAEIRIAHDPRPAP
jgi:hypothetical protein